MSNVNNILINKVCRTCLSAAEDMKSLYEASSTSKKICLAELLMSCTSLKCFETDGFPTTICRNCIRELNQLDTFQLKCLESEEILRNYITGERNMLVKATIKNVIGVKIEIDDDLNDDYKINSSPKTSPQEITNVSDAFNSLLNKKKLEKNKTSICDTVHCSNKTIELNYPTLKPLNQEFDTIKREQDMNREIVPFEEVSVNTEFPVSLEHGVTYEENPNLKFARLHSPDISNITDKSLKDPLTISEISEDMSQRLDLIKHEVDFQIKIETEDTNNELNKSWSQQQQLTKLSTINYEASSLIGDKSMNTKPIRKNCDGNKLKTSLVSNCSTSDATAVTVTVQTKTGAKLYTCTVCNSSFKLNKYLTSHMRKHINEKPFMCFICKKSFGKKYILNMHLRTHTGEKPYTCTICNDTFRQSQHLKLHNLHMHTEEKPYPCTVCDKSFKQKQQFTYHMRKHTGEKPYSCTVCSISFGQPQSLKIHLRAHTGEKPYPCTVCDSSFMQKSQLLYHMRSHTGEKPYPCTFCDRSFITKQHLTSHMRTHTGEKPYSCTVCNMTFGHNHNLKLHMRTHTGEKPYTCAVCNNSYRQKQYFKTHMRSHIIGLL